MSSISKLASALIGAVAITGFAQAASAADYPVKPITMIVPTAAGGGVDTQARALAPVMEEVLGQPVRIVNKKGAGGTVGLQSMILPAKPDGYTIAAAASVSIIENPILQGLSYGVDDVTIIATTGSFQGAIVAAGSAPYDTWDEFIAHAKANPGTKWYSLGKITVKMMNAIAEQEGLDIAIVPGQGGATLAPTLLAGDADVSISGGIHAPFLANGELKVLLSTLSNGQLMATPDVPSSFEKYGVSLDNNLVILAPKGLPTDIAEKLAEAVEIAAQSERHKEVMATIQYPVTYMNSADATAMFLEREARSKETLK